MKTHVLMFAVLSLLSGCETLRDIENPLATAYSEFDEDGDGVGDAPVDFSDERIAVTGRYCSAVTIARG